MRSTPHSSPIGSWLKRHVCVLALLVVATVRSQPISPAPKNLPAIQRQALAFMADITPAQPIEATPIKISCTPNHAFWGKFFGDQQIAALVAIDLVQAKDHEPGSNADLCLLLWNHGWKFHQWVGKVSATTVGYDDHWDWALKHRSSTQTWYLVSHLDLYPPGEHLSWKFDPPTHTLLPTGWPPDAVPSIARDTVTFTRQDKPGFSPTIRDVYRYSDHLGQRLASLNDAAEPPGNAATFILWDEPSGQTVSWQVRAMSRNNSYALGRTAGESSASPFREDAVAMFAWDDQQADHAVTNFLWRQLSGLSDNSLRGLWDEDGQNDAAPPRTVTVTGLPAAVERFSWPRPETLPH